MSFIIKLKIHRIDNAAQSRLQRRNVEIVEV